MARIVNVMVDRFGTDSVRTAALKKAQGMEQANNEAKAEGQPEPHPRDQIELWADIKALPKRDAEGQKVLDEAGNPILGPEQLFWSTRRIEVSALQSEPGDTLEIFAQKALVLYDTKPRIDKQDVSPIEWLSHKVSKHYHDKERQAARSADLKYGQTTTKTKLTPEERETKDLLSKLTPEKRAEFLQMLQLSAQTK